MNSPYGHNVTAVGRCGICGGRVVVPTAWWSVVPPVPTCEQCGATHHQEDNLPVLPMRPPAKTFFIASASDAGKSEQLIADAVRIASGGNPTSTNAG